MAAFVLLRQEFHGEVNAFQLASGNGEIARMFSASCENDGVEIAAQIFYGDILADFCIGDEVHALGAHLIESPVDNVLFEFELGDTVAQQAADAVSLFVHGDRVAGAAQLPGCSQTRWSGAHNGNFFSATNSRRLGVDPAFAESTLDDIFLVLLDRDRGLIDAQHAGGFAGRGTDASGEFGKVVGGVQLANRFLPTAAIDEIVPVGNQIVDRASCLAEGNPTIHTARALIAQSFLGKVDIDFEPIIHALYHRTARGMFSRVFKEAGGFTHAVPARVESARGRCGA